MTQTAPFAKLAKYYITSGKLRFVTSAQDAASAALWALHQYLDRQCTDGQADDADEIERQAIIAAVLQMDETVFVSEIGFGRNDAGTIDTVDLVSEWNRCAVAVQRLHRLHRDSSEHEAIEN